MVISPRSNRKAPRENDKEMYKWQHLADESVQEGRHAGGKDGFIFSARIYLAATHRLAITSTVPSD